MGREKILKAIHNERAKETELEQLPHLEERKTKKFTGRTRSREGDKLRLCSSKTGGFQPRGKGVEKAERKGQGRKRAL